MPRPDFLPPRSHYSMGDYTFKGSTTRRDPDLLALQVWADQWTDDTTPRTDRPVRFVWREVWRKVRADGYPESVRIPSRIA